MIFLIILLLVVAGLLHSLFYLRAVEEAYPAAGEFKTIGGLKLHYLDLNPQATGKAPVVLIHGVSSSLLDMKEGLGEALAEDRRVILIDRPGFGHSDREQGNTGIGRQVVLIEKLLDALNVENPVVIAHSFGGSVALRHTLNFPERARALILLAPVSHRWPGGVAWHNHAAVLPIIGPIFTRTVPAAYGRLAGKKAVSQAFWPREEPAGYWDKAGIPLIFRPTAFRATAEDLVGLYDEIIRMEPLYGQIAQPVHMLAGTHDTTVLSTIHCMGLEKKVTNTTLEYLPDVGHPIQHASLDRVRAILAEIDAAN